MADEVPDWAQEQPSTPEPQASGVPDWAQEPSQEAAPAAPAGDDNLDHSTTGMAIRRATEGALVGVPTLPIAHAAGLGGAALGGVLGSAVPGVGTAAGAGVGYVGGALVGALGGGYLIDKAKEWALEKAGLREGEGFFSAAQKEADIKEHPIGSDVAELIGSSGGAFGVFGAKLAQRAAGAVIMGGLEGGRQLSEGEFDPTKLAIQTLGGAALAKPNKFGEKLNQAGEALVPKAWSAPHSPRATSDSVGNAESKPPPTSDESVTATEAAPVRSEQNYGKETPAWATTKMTSGLIDPTTLAALDQAGDAVVARKNPAPTPDTKDPVQLAQTIKAMATKMSASEIGAKLGMNHNEVRAIRDNPLPNRDNVTATETPPVEAPKAGSETPTPEQKLKTDTEITNKPPEPAVEETPKTGGSQPFEQSGGADTYKIGVGEGEGVTVKRMRQPDPVTINDDGTVNISTKIPTLLDMGGRGLDPSYPLTVRADVEHAMLKGGHATDAEHAKELGRRAQDDWLTKNGYDPKLFNDQIDKLFQPKVAAPKGVAGRPKEDIAAKAAADLRANGREDLAKRIEALPEGPNKEKAAAALHAAGVVNKTGGAAPNLKNVRLRGPKTNLEVDGLGVEAGTKTVAAERTKAVEGNIKVLADEAHLPVKDESKEALVARAQKMLAAARTESSSPLAYKPVAPFHEEAKVPEAQRTERMKARAAWELLNNAQRLVDGKLSPSKFRANEELLRGDMESVLAYIDDKRGAGTIAKDKQTGDKAVEAQQAKVAEEQISQPHEEGGVIEAEMALERAKEYEADVTKRAQRMAPDDKARAVAKAKTVVQQAEAALKEAEAQEAKVGVRKEIKTAADIPAEAPPAEKNKKWENLTLAEQNELLGKKQDKNGIWHDEEGGLNVGAIKDAFKPSEDFVARSPKSEGEKEGRSLQDRLHKLKQTDVAYMGDQQKFVKQLPAVAKDEKKATAGYLAREKGELNKLSPEDQKRWDEHVKPWIEQNAKLLEILRKFAPNKVGAFVTDHIMRIRHGYSPELDMFMQGTGADPVAGAKGLSIGNHGTMNDRVFQVLEDANKNRHVISIDKDGYTLWKDGTGKHVKSSEFEFAEGQPFTDKNGKTWIMRGALTPEIEAHARFEDGTRARYYKNDLLSALMAHKQLREAVMHLHELDMIKHSDEFKALSTTIADKAEKNWITTKQPNFKGYYMDPQLAHTLDDFARPGFEGMEWYRKLSQQVTKTIFLNPVVHSLNVGYHWAVARGFEWIKPTGYLHLAEDMAMAMKHVWTQSPEYRAAQRAGSGLVYGSVDTANFMKNIGDGLGMDIQRNRTKWGAIASKFNMNPADLYHAVSEASSRGMWTASDMFMMHGYIERQRLHPGESVAKTIAMVEKDIPNYRVPVTILGTGGGARFLSRLMQDPALFAFGRYHYGVFNSYANIIKDAVGGTGAERTEAIGKMMVMAALMFAVKPLLDKAAAALTGNKDAEVHARGPLTIPTVVMKALQGKTDLSQALRDTMTIAPLTSSLIDLGRGKDFTGKDIIQPGTVKRAVQGSPAAAARVVGQGADYAAKSLFAPYGVASAEANKGRNPLETIRDQALDIRNPSPKEGKYLAGAEKRDAQAYKHPKGLLERMFNKVGF